MPKANTNQVVSVPLSEVYFGKDDAETDVARGGLLKEGFLKTAAYEVALAGEKSLILGRKGSGKSATCLMLEMFLKSDGRISLITPDEISAEEIRRFQLAGIQLNSAKALLWRYLFAIQIAKYLLSKEPQDISGEAKKHLQEIRRFLVDNGEIIDLSFVERFWKIAERLKGSLSVGAFGTKVGVDVQYSSKGIEASENIQTFEQKLSQAAHLLGVGDEAPPFYLLVDQLEKVWSNDRESDAMVIGLLMAAKHVRGQFTFVRCAVFMRVDIYEHLQFGDRDKFRGDEFLIEWNKERLLDLILARVKASSKNKLTTESQLWNGVFTQSVDGVNTGEFLVERTLMRPRDLIQLCNACRDRARVSGRNSISDSDVREAVSLYSSWKLSDLENEWLVNLPFLHELHILLGHVPYILRRDAFVRIFDAVRPDLINRYPSLAGSFSVENILNTLYSIGLLGVVKKGATKYQATSTGNERVELNDAEFVIHPCFRDALQSTSALDLEHFPDLAESQLELRGRELIGSNAGPHQQTIRVRGGASSRFISSVINGLTALRDVVLRSNLPAELRSELALRLTKILSTLSETAATGDVQSIRLVASQVLSHMDKLSNKLETDLWFARDRDVKYAVVEIRELLNRFVSRQSFEEYASGPSDPSDPS